MHVCADSCVFALEGFSPQPARFASLQEMIVVDAAPDAAEGKTDPGEMPEGFCIVIDLAELQISQNCRQACNMQA